MKEINLEKLRKSVAFKGGITIENLLKTLSLIKEIKNSIEEENIDRAQKNTNINITYFSTILNYLEKSLKKNLEVVRNGITETLEIISFLEKETINRKLLERETQLLRKVAFTKENIFNWKEFSAYLIREMKKIYNFDSFFIYFIEKQQSEVYIFFSYHYNKKIIECIKKEILQSLRLNPNTTKIEETYIHKSYKKKEHKKCVLRYQSFFPEDTDIGGKIGTIVLTQKNLSVKENEIINSLLSIMTLTIGSFRTISKIISELEYYAGHDPLTNLYNRRTFEDFLGYEVSRAKRKGYKFSIALIDLDNFKLINDTYGHPVGDIVLELVADTIENSVREGDMVARVGGDEFIVLLSDTDIEKGMKIVKRIKENLEKQKIQTLDGDLISIQASFGLVEFPTHGKTKEELLMVVDSALYKAKSLGKNTIYIPSREEIQEVINMQKKEFKALQEAIEKNLFIPYFQPIFDIKNKQIIAYEVLARVLDENNNAVSAYRLIRLAEKTKKIKEIELLIIEKSLKQKTEKKSKKKLFINLSPQLMSDNIFWESIDFMVSKYKITPEEIIFEITERETIKNIPETQQFIKSLKKRGYGFAIDDFGSGYSSFHYLKYFPINYVKIDGEFIKEIRPEDERSTAFVESINFLCTKLSIETVAEHIENEETLNALKSIGIPYGQGFYLGKPQPDFL